MTPTLASICTDLGVSAVPTAKRREPGETCAVATLERILATRGSDHMRDVLMTLMETTNHKRELTAPVLWAVSDILTAHPTWFCGSRWFDVIDGIDIGAIRERARTMRPVPPRHAIAAMLLERLQQHFESEPQHDLFWEKVG